MKKLILLAIIAFCSSTVQADSPLTSTNFYTVYEEYDIVNQAIEANGKINNEIMLYLSDKRFPIDVKVAVVNALGWNYDGQNNYNVYLNFLEMRKGAYSGDESFYNRIDGDELLCLAYLKAMDNYFDVQLAKEIAELALEKSFRTQHSYTFNLINALIGAQIAMDENWCQVYKLTQNVKQHKDLKQDFPEEAEEIVFSYMDLYKADCKE